jgi:hypothetical protein
MFSPPPRRADDKKKRRYERRGRLDPSGTPLPYIRANSPEYCWTAAACIAASKLVCSWINRL